MSDGMFAVSKNTLEWKACNMLNVFLPHGNNNIGPFRQFIMQIITFACLKKTYLLKIEIFKSNISV